MAAKCGEGLQVLASTLVAVHHIGSTSVPGLAAKPIIDLMPVVTRLDALPHAYTDEKAAWIERTQGKALAWFDKLS